MADKLTIQSEVDISLKDKGKEADGQLDKILKKIKSIEAAVKKQTTATVNGFNKVTGALKRTNKAATTLEKTEKRSSKSRLRQVATTITMYAGIGTVIYGAVASFKKLTLEVLELNRSLSKVQAITRSTDETIAMLKNTVLATSAVFNVGTDEMGKFVITTAKLGVSAKNVGELATESVVLSKILGEDMSESGTLLVTTLKAFNMTLAESATITSTFYDLIRKTPASVKELRTAMQYVAPAAAATGVSLREASKMMELLFNRGLKASKVGTGLRNMFAEISESGEDVIDVLRDMSKGGYSFSDAVSQFGKRGAIAATILVQNFGELETLLGQNLPASFETLEAALIATENTMDRFGSTWERLKLIFNEEARIEFGKTNNIRKLREYLDSYGKELEDVYEDFMSGMNIDEIYKKYGLEGSHIGNIGAYLGIRSYGDSVLEQKRVAEEVKKAQERAKLEISKNLLKRSPNKGETIKDILNEYIASEADGVASSQKISDLYKGAVARSASQPNNIFLQTLVKELQTAIGASQTITSGSQIATEALTQYRKYHSASGDIIKQTGLDLKERERFLKQAAEATKNLRVFCESGDPIVLATGLCDNLNKSRDVDKSIDIGGLTSGRKVEDYVPDFNAGEWKRRLEGGIMSLASGGDITDISGDLGDYYNTIVDGIITAEQEALIDLDLRRTQASDEYSAVTFDIESLMAGTDGKTREGYQKQLISAAKEYGAAISSIESQEVSVVEDSNEAKAAAYKKYIDTITRLRKTKESNDALDLKSEEDKWKDYLRLVSDGIGALSDIYKKFAQENLNNRLDYIASELEAVQSRSDVESDILSSQFDNNIITAEAYAKKREELEKREIEQKNALNKAAFEAQKKADINSAIVNGAANAAQAFISTFIQAQGGLISKGAQAAIGAGIVVAKTGAEIAAINKRKFYPVKYAEGGEVNGASHSEGGVPFSVAGQGGYEMEGGEYIVNKEATARNKALLDSINFKDKKYSDSKFFANGGQVNGSNDTSGALSKEQVIRAYITKRDLRDYTDNESRNSKIRKL